MPNREVGDGAWLQYGRMHALLLDIGGCLSYQGLSYKLRMQAATELSSSNEPRRVRCAWSMTWQSHLSKQVLH